MAGTAQATPTEGPWGRPSYTAQCGDSRCGQTNIVLSGVAMDCYVRQFADPISIKTAYKGQVEWRLEGRRYLIQPDTLLFLPDGDEYELTIHSVTPTRGFNALFRRGLVEDCWRTMVATHETLLDDPYELKRLSFTRRLESNTGPLGLALGALMAAVAARASLEVIDNLFESLGERAADCVCEQRRERRRPTAIKPSTRHEIHRRLCRAREAIENQLAAPWTLTTMSRAGMMAPHHFHRTFKVTFGETPRAWLSRRRAERAMALLRTTERSVTEVCFEVGYLSLTSFSSSFLRRYGIPPSKI